MFVQVVMSCVVILSHGGFFERPVHPVHLTLGPGMVGCGQPMVNPMLMTNAFKEMLQSVNLAVASRELDAVIGQHRVALVGDRGYQVP